MSLTNNTTAQSKARTGIKPTSAGSSSTPRWYGLYAAAKTYTGIDTETTTYTVQSTKIKSTMITGACYDAIMNWALNSGNDSTKVTQEGNALHTYDSVQDCGSAVNDKINNIMDLEGNIIIK